MTADMERRTSREVVGVSIFRREDSIAVRMVVSTPTVRDSLDYKS